MYSNFITPPDFVEDKFHTVTIINATLEEVELLGRMCQGLDDQLNIYLYRHEMKDLTWLEKAVDRSDAVIINTACLDPELSEYLKLEKTYYYGATDFITKANKVDTVFEYFALRYSQQNK